MYLILHYVTLNFFVRILILYLQVRIFRFASGKMTKVFDESLQHYSELQQVCLSLVLQVRCVLILCNVFEKYVTVLVIFYVIYMWFINFR